jgi:hypothetical protein
MLVALLLVTAASVSAVTWMLLRASRRRVPVRRPDLELLPAEDRAPITAVGWPPGGRRFSAYVDDGFRALDAYLAHGVAPDDGTAGLA